MTRPDHHTSGGWKLVPVEPTEAMLTATGKAWTPTMQEMWPMICGDIYRAMLAAAPEPDSGGWDGICCPACRGSGREITEDNFRSCTACGGDGAFSPPPSAGCTGEGK